MVSKVSLPDKEDSMLRNTKKRTASTSVHNRSVNLPSIILPKPKFERGTSLLKALQQRQTIREIQDKKLSMQLISNLLWAAYGVNRKKGPFGIPGRTAASASNSQEIELYVAMKEGIYLYSATDHRLIPVAAGDLRTLAIGPGQAEFAVDAPVQLIYIVDIDKLSHTAGYQEPGLQDPEVQKSYYYVDTGLIAGNVSIFAASQGLASWFHNCDKAGFAAHIRLRAGQRILFGQTIGYPVKK